jgi:hypothetical protein
MTWSAPSRCRAPRLPLPRRRRSATPARAPRPSPPSRPRKLPRRSTSTGLHLDTLQAQDAVNRLRSRKEDLTYGQNGFMQVKGGEVINPNRPGGPLLDDYKARFQAVSDDVSKSLSPRAREMFQARSDAEFTSFKGEIGRHSLQQTEQFNIAVDKDTQQQTLAEAARYAADPVEDRPARRAGEDLGPAARRVAGPPGRGRWAGGAEQRLSRRRRDLAGAGREPAGTGLLRQRQGQAGRPGSGRAGAQAQGHGAPMSRATTWRPAMSASRFPTRSSSTTR